MRIPKGLLKQLNIHIKISVSALSDYAAVRKRPGRKRALELENACRELGIDVPAMVWLYGESDEIKSRILRQHSGNGYKSETAPKNQVGVKPRG